MCTLTELCLSIIRLRNIISHVTTTIDSLNLKLVLNMCVIVKSLSLLHTNRYTTLWCSILIVTAKHTSCRWNTFTINTCIFLCKFRAIHCYCNITIYHGFNSRYGSYVTRITWCARGSNSKSSKTATVCIADCTTRQRNCGLELSSLCCHFQETTMLFIICFTFLGLRVRSY